MFKVCILIFTAFFFYILYPEINIRPAQQDDLEAVLELDRIISWEYFKPLFLQYTGLILSQKPDELLEDDLKKDRTMLSEGINHINNQRLLVACDQNDIVGFASYQKEDLNIHVNLIFINKEYRNRKIGKRLMDSVLHTFADTRSCTLFVLDKNISACRMYEAYGFKACAMPDAIKQELPADASHIYIFYRFELGAKEENTLDQL